EREAVREAFESYASRGLRVLGLAQKKAEGTRPEERGRAESGLTFLGLAALEDPPRPEVKDAVARCHRAGIKIIVVTGDHALTAEAVARQVGIVRDEPTVVTGAEVERLKREELDAL